MLIPRHAIAPARNAYIGHLGAGARSTPTAVAFAMSAGAASSCEQKRNPSVTLPVPVGNKEEIQ